MSKNDFMIVILVEIINKLNCWQRIHVLKIDIKQTIKLSISFSNISTTEKIYYYAIET